MSRKIRARSKQITCARRKLRCARLISAMPAKEGALVTKTKRAAQQRHRSALQNYMGLNSKERPSMRAAQSTSWATSLQMRSDSCYLSPVHRMSSCRICRASVAPATTVTKLVAMGPSKKCQNQPNGGMAARGVHSCDADRRDGCGETRADRRDGEKHTNVMRRRTR